MVTPAPSTAATTVGTTRASAKTPAPLAPRTFATSIAARAAAPVERKLVTIVIETLRTSFTVVPSFRAGPGDQRLAGLPLGPSVVERPVQVVGRADEELLGAEDCLQQLLDFRLLQVLEHGLEVADEAAVAAEEREPLADHLARVEEHGLPGRSDRDRRAARAETLDGLLERLAVRLATDALEDHVDLAAKVGEALAVVAVECLADERQCGAPLVPAVAAHGDGRARHVVHAGEADRDELSERAVAEDQVAALGPDRRLLAAGEDGGERLGERRDAVGDLRRHRDEERRRVAEHALREPVRVARQVEVVQAVILARAARPAGEAALGLRGVEVGVGDVAGHVRHHDDPASGTRVRCRRTRLHDLGHALVEEGHRQLLRERAAVARARVELQVRGADAGDPRPDDDVVGALTLDLTLDRLDAERLGQAIGDGGIPLAHYQPSPSLGRSRSTRLVANRKSWYVVILKLA